MWTLRTGAGMDVRLADLSLTHLWRLTMWRQPQKKAALCVLARALNSWQQCFIRAVTSALWLCSTLLVRWWNGCSSKSLISRRSQRLKSGLSRRFESIKCPRFIEAQKVACIELMPRGRRFTSRHLSSQSKASHVERNGVIPKRHNYYRRKL